MVQEFGFHVFGKPVAESLIGWMVLKRLASRLEKATGYRSLRCGRDPDSQSSLLNQRSTEITAYLAY